ncbi:MAG: PEP-CTERM sorting domain-containing protein [Planctomycetota bacterium]
MLQSTFGVRPSGMVADDILINLGRNFATIVGYDGNYVGSLNEDLHYDDLAFSHFNTGTWVYGGGSTTLNGITLQIGSAAVPEPSSMALLMIGAVGVAARRKRRIPIA